MVTSIKNHHHKKVMDQENYSIAPEPYYLMKAALSLFQKTPKELNETELDKAKKQASLEYSLENKILKSKEAASIVISEQQLSKAFEQISGRFNGEDNFNNTLQHNGLNQQSLSSALLRQCKVEQVMEIIASRAADVTDAEVDIFYHMHPEQFKIPEQRTVAHILITINPDFPENEREQAYQRINQISRKLGKKPHLFADLAMKNSECPSAMNGGLLGTFKRGKLYLEIEQALFSLKEGDVSSIIETQAGFHVIKCLKIERSHTTSLKKARPKIKQIMQSRLQRVCQRAWIASLPAEENTQP